MTTLKEVAAACGVSTASASKALNNAPDIGLETAQRIRDAAQRMGYFPNSAARALKTNHTHNLGVLFVDATFCGLTHEFFAPILNSFKVEAERLGYDMTFISRDLGGTNMSYLEHCRYRRCDGVMIASVNFADPCVVELVSSDIPVVTIDYVFDNRGAVLSDNVQGMHDLFHYVYNMGHRKIAFIHGEDTAVTRYRLASFYRCCEECGIRVPEQYVKAATYHDPRASGLMTRELLALPEPPTCILYPDDISFLGGMSEIERHGLRIPEDISVTGCDGIGLSQMLRPKLTTIHQDAEKLGTEAALLLVQAIETPKTYIPKRVVVPAEVWEGGTVKRLV